LETEAEATGVEAEAVDEIDASTSLLSTRLKNVWIFDNP